MSSSCWQKIARLSAALLPLALTPAAHATTVTPADIDQEKELIIRDLGVVEWTDPHPGPHGHRLGIENILAQISRDGTAKTALLEWMDAWVSVFPRPNGLPPITVTVGANLLQQWMVRDGATSRAAWRPNFQNAPFRLLAITNRMDLQRRDADGLPLSAGEGRLIFGVTLGPGATGQALKAAVIFEFSLPARSEGEVLAWAQAWHGLKSFPNFDDHYGEALAALTGRFVGRATLNQIRTNEIDLSNAGEWNLREFRADPATGVFFAATTKQTPDGSFATSQVLSDYINAHVSDILQQRHAVPRLIGPQAFLGTQADVASAGQIIWNPPNVPNAAARYLFALNTCNGCHGVEAQTANFMHVSARAPGAVSELSSFLQDAPPVDQAGQSNIAHPELKEITARKNIMVAVLNEQPPNYLLLSLTERARWTVPPAGGLLQLIRARAGRED